MLAAKAQAERRSNSKNSANSSDASTVPVVAPITHELVESRLNAMPKRMRNSPDATPATALAATMPTTLAPSGSAALAGMASVLAATRAGSAHMLSLRESSRSVAWSYTPATTSVSATHTMDTR